MADISVKRRRFEIRKVQKRKVQLKKLRKLFALAKTQKEKDRILEKFIKIAPHLSKQEFINPGSVKKKVKVEKKVEKKVKVEKKTEKPKQAKKKEKKDEKSQSKKKKVKIK